MTKKVITLKLDEEVLEDLEHHAADLGDGMTRHALMCSILKTWVKKHPIDAAAKRRIRDQRRSQAQKMEKMGVDAAVPAGRTGPARNPRRRATAASGRRRRTPKVAS